MRPARYFRAVRLSLAVGLMVAVSVFMAGPASAAPCAVGDITYEVGTEASIVTYTGPGGELTIPASITCAGQDYPVTTIGTEVFDPAKTGVEITSVTIPNSIHTIGPRAFLRNSLTSLTIPDTVTSLGVSAFDENLISTLTIGSGLTTIAPGAFKANQLTSVTIPDSVTSIGDEAFYGNRLSSVDLGAGLTSIGRGAFLSNRLTSVTIPDSVTSIGAQAFQANMLTSVDLGTAVTSIGEFAFMDNALTSVTIPGAVTSIGQAAFAFNPLVDVTFSGPAPTVITGPPGFVASLGPDPNLVVSFHEAYLDPDPGTPTAGLFTTPTWMGYATRMIVADTTAPSVTVEQATGQDDPTATAPVLFTATFSEPVIGLEASDVMVSGTAGATVATSVTSADGGTTWTIEVGNLSAAGTVTVAIPAGAATDAAGNSNTASTSVDNTVTITVAGGDADAEPDGTGGGNTISGGDGVAARSGFLPNTGAPISLLLLLGAIGTAATGALLLRRRLA